MQVAIIAPIKHLQDFSSQGDIAMCLAHLYLESLEYREYYTEQVRKGRFVILDNGLYENGKSISMTQLIDIVEKLRPSEVVAPDALFNGARTYMNAVEFMDKMDQRKLLASTKVMVVIQGSTPREWRECYRICTQSFPHITIGLSKLAIPKCFGSIVDESPVTSSRLDVLIYLSSFSHKHQYHLLGGDNWLAHELNAAKYFDFIRSNDSSVAVNYGAYNLTFDNANKIYTTLPNFNFNMQIDENKFGYINSNIETLLKVSK